MPAHIYMRTGNYQGAVAANAKAADVDRQYIASTGAGGVYPLMYYNHNLDFLASAAMMAGQFAKARESADLLVANVLPAIEQMAMIEPFGAKKLYVLLRFARWDDVMKLPAPNPQHALLTMLSHFGRGVAQAARGNAADAEREREAYRAAQRRVSPDFDWGYNKARNMFAVSDAVLNAWIARARRDDAGALDAWRTAVLAEDALSYNEPADWFYPTRESLGAALLRAKAYGQAEEVFRQDLTRNPGNGRSLYGLWQSLLLQKKESAAAAEKTFRSAWKNADVQLDLRHE